MVDDEYRKETDAFVSKHQATSIDDLLTRPNVKKCMMNDLQLLRRAQGIERVIKYEAQKISATDYVVVMEKGTEVTSRPNHEELKKLAETIYKLHERDLSLIHI